MLQSSIASQTAGIKTSGLALKHAPQEFYLRGEQIQRSKASQLAATCANFNKPPLNVKIQKAVLLPGRATPASARHASPPRRYSGTALYRVVLRLLSYCTAYSRRNSYL